MTDIIDLSQLAPPTVVELLDYETALADIKALIIAQFDAAQQASIAATLALESEPLTKAAQAWAYREQTYRQRINDAAKAVMLAYAGGADLDHLVAHTDTQRLTIDEGDPLAVPPVDPTYEADNALRQRALLAWSRLSVAGPEGAYKYHALSASGDVASVSVISPAEGVVQVTILGQNGEPALGTLDTVLAALSVDGLRPLTDFVTVAAAEIIEYQITAVLYVRPGPDATVVLAAAQAAVEKLAADNFVMGRDITLSNLYAALNQSGVHDVNIISPPAKIVISPTQAARCTQITLSIGGRDE